MTQVVTVHTDFTDLNQMAQGLVGRVNDTHVILPGPDPVDVGEWVEFAVTLYDGTPGFAGVGRCVTVVDNGEERLAHQRFDVVIDSLQFDSRGQQVFEHILTLNGAAGYEAAGAAAEEVAPSSEHIEDANFEDVSEVYTNSKIELPTEALEEAVIAARVSEEHAPLGPSPDEMATATYAVEAPADEPIYADDDVQAVSEPPSEPAPAATNGAAAPTSAIPISVAPEAPAAARHQTNGIMFVYPGGLTFPSQPPRPDLEAEKRVSPAPRPSSLTR